MFKLLVHLFWELCLLQKLEQFFFEIFLHSLITLLRELLLALTL